MTTEKKSVSRLVNIQHEHNEETEFYPSTQEIADSVARWISSSPTITERKIMNRSGAIST